MKTRLASIQSATVRGLRKRAARCSYLRSKSAAERWPTLLAVRQADRSPLSEVTLQLVGVCAADRCPRVLEPSRQADLSERRGV